MQLNEIYEVFAEQIYQSDMYGFIEVEDYIFEPVTVRLETLVRASVEMGDALVGLIEKIDASLLESDEDCKDLKSDLEESKKAWHNYELHRR